MSQLGTYIIYTYYLLSCDHPASIPLCFLHSTSIIIAMFSCSIVNVTSREAIHALARRVLDTKDIEDV